MVSFEEHLQQAKSNLSALRVVLDTDHFDWQVTISFYTAFHIAAAHMAHYNVHANTHLLIKKRISPFEPESEAKADEDAFIGYCALEVLSRKARYLHKNEQGKKAPLKALFSDPIDAAEALHCLNDIMIYFSRKYEADFETTKVKSPQVAKALEHSIQYFFI